MTRDAKVALLDDVATHGRGAWLDPKSKAQFLVLWKSLDEWGDAIYAWAVAHGLKDSVVTVDEVQRGEEVAGSELEGLPREVLLRAIKVLESKGKAK